MHIHKTKISHAAASSLAAMFILGPVAHRPLTADVPRMVHYQGKLLNSSGRPVEASVALRFRLYADATSQTPALFDEAHSSVRVEKGVFNALIGSITPGGVPDSALESPAVYLGINVNDGAEMTPRTRLSSNPYTLKSFASEVLVRPGSLQPAATVDGVGQVGIGTRNPAALLDVTGDGKTVLLPRKSDAPDPAPGADGMMYYNQATGRFRGHEDGAWADMRGGSTETTGGACDCPETPWSVYGVINGPGLAETGDSPTSVNISDNSREYFLAFYVTSGDFNFEPNPPFVILPIRGDMRDVARTAAAVQNTNGSWMQNYVEYVVPDGYWANYHIPPPDYRAYRVAKGAAWSAAEPAGVILTHSFSSGTNRYATYFGSIQVYSNGDVRVSDARDNHDVAAVIFSR